MFEDNVVDVARRLCSDFEAGILGFQDAIAHGDVGGGSVVLGLARGLHHDAVVAGGDAAIADLDVLAMVGVNAVAVGDIEAVGDGQMVHEDVFAAEIWRPQEGASPKVMSRISRLVQPVSMNILGRQAAGSHHSPAVS